MSKLREVYNLALLARRDVVAPLQHRFCGATGMLVCKPTQVNVEIIDRCCLKCRMCDIWKHDGVDELTIAEWKSIVDSLVQWLKTFRLTVTGGEPFMRAGIWEFLEHCINLDLPVVVITNGFCLNERLLRRLAALRLAQVVFSIDDIDSTHHDDVRGVAGAFTRVWEAVSTLARSKRRFLLATNTVITRRNIANLGKIASGLSDLGVERIFFQPVQGGFIDNSTPSAIFRSDLWPNSPSEIDKGIDSLLIAQSDGVPIANTSDEIEQFRSYFHLGSQWQRPWVCSTQYDTIHFDAVGNMRMCVPYAGAFGNARHEAPEALWKSAAAQAERTLIGQCTKPCLLNCNRAYSLGERASYALQLLAKRTS